MILCEGAAHVISLPACHPPSVYLRRRIKYGGDSRNACFEQDGSIFVAEWVGTGRVSKLKRLA